MCHQITLIEDFLWNEVAYEITNDHMCVIASGFRDPPPLIYHDSLHNMLQSEQDLQTSQGCLSCLGDAIVKHEHFVKHTVLHTTRVLHESLSFIQ